MVIVLVVVVVVDKVVKEWVDVVCNFIDVRLILVVLELQYMGVYEMNVCVYFIEQFFIYIVGNQFYGVICVEVYFGKFFEGFVCKMVVVLNIKCLFIIECECYICKSGQ